MLKWLGQAHFIPELLKGVDFLKTCKNSKVTWDLSQDSHSASWWTLASRGLPSTTISSFLQPDINGEKSIWLTVSLDETPGLLVLTWCAIFNKWGLYVCNVGLIVTSLVFTKKILFLIFKKNQKNTIPWLSAKKLSHSVTQRKEGKI